MFKTEDILAELAAGKSIEEVAQNCADVLNAAKFQYDKEQEEKKAAEEAAKKAALQKRKEKEGRAGDIFSDMMRYLADFHPTFFSHDEFAEMSRKFDPGALVDAIDQTIGEIEKIPVVAEQLKNRKPSGPFEINVELKNEDAKKAEDAIEKFLRENKLF